MVSKELVRLYCRLISPFVTHTTAFGKLPNENGVFFKKIFIKSKMRPFA